MISIGQGDTERSTILYAPTIGAVVGGDVVYNQVHTMTAETDEKGREDWIASLSQIADLQPRIVVSGHKRVGAADDPRTIGESRQYLRDFSRVVASQDTVEDIVAAMLKLHPDRDNPRVVWHCAGEAVSRQIGRANAGLAPAVLPQIAQRLYERGKLNSFIDLFNHRSVPSKVLTPPRLAAATARLLPRRGCGRRALLGEVGALIAEDVRRKRLARHPHYAPFEASKDAGRTEVEDDDAGSLR